MGTEERGKIIIPGDESEKIELQTSGKDCDPKNEAQRLNSSNEMNASSSSNENTPTKTGCLSFSQLNLGQKNLDIFQALEISYNLLSDALHPNYLEKKLGEFGEYSKFKELQETRIKLLKEIALTSRRSRGSWQSKEIPEPLFASFSLKVQLADTLEKLISVLERRADDQYLKRVLSPRSFMLYKEAQRVRWDAQTSSSFLLRRNDNCEENTGTVKKRKFELMPLKNNYYCDYGEVGNRSCIEERCTPPKRRLTFE